MKDDKKISKGKVLAGAAGLAAIGAGAYYLLGPKAKAHQKKAKELIDNIKEEVESEIKKVKATTLPLYHKAVDAIEEKYNKKYKKYEKEIKSIAKKIKDEWEEE